MDREVAVSSIQARVRNANLMKHMLATEAIMSALARRLGQDEAEWGLTGLLHDIDVEMTEHQPQSHSKIGADVVREMGASESVCRAVLCHNEAHGIPCETLLDKALFCVDPLTGLITAGALVRPDKSLAGLTSESLMKRFKEKRFAAGANREAIASCQQIGLELDEFVSLGLEAMKGITADLGL
jgi:putative nucleotidyltransferase with HDIG domain